MLLLRLRRLLADGDGDGQGEGVEGPSRRVWVRLARWCSCAGSDSILSASTSPAKQIISGKFVKY